MKKIRSINMLSKTIVILLVLVAVFVFAFYRIFKEYENGVLEVSAGSQDGYVELVINQIELKENRTDAQITKIIQTLDSSTNKYWTFSKGSNILYVKNVLETNRYKGVSASAYYTSKSARTFIASLSQNVSHARISVAGKQYMASGGLFTYKNQQYRLILLTSLDVLLDNNTYLSAKMAMITMIGLLIVLFAVAPMVIAWYYLRLAHKNHQLQTDIGSLNRALAIANKEVNDQLIYHEKEKVWNIGLLDTFIENLKERKIACLTVQLSFTQEEKQDFIQNGYHLIDQKYICFDGGDSLTLLFVRLSKAEAKELFENLHLQVVQMREYREE